MWLLGFGSIFYFSLLLTNSIAILNEERFLVPLGLTASSSQAQNQLNQQNQFDSNNNINYNSGFENYGTPTRNESDGPGIKMRLIALVAAIRTLMRGKVYLLSSHCQLHTDHVLIL